MASFSSVRAWTAAAATLLAICSWHAVANGQQGLVYQPPGGSPFSPYLNLFRRDTGLLNQYYNYIVPQRRLESTLQQQSSAISGLQTQVQGVRGELRQVQTAPIGPTGVGAGYMNYSHYYPTAPPIAAPR
jgi:hypothetical protein